MNFRAAMFTTVAGVALVLRAADERAPSGLPVNVKEMRSSEFTSEQYFDPPNEQKLKLRLSGASVAPLPDGLQEVSEVRIELFNTNGLTRAVAGAPSCEFQPFKGVASSSGQLKMESGDGKFHMEGKGFLWQRNEMTLILSNHVHTVLQMGVTNSFFKL